MKGNFQCNFSGSRANSIPLLAELNRFVPAFELLDTTISSGSIGGRLNGDQVQIDDIYLNSSAFWVVGEGTADLGNSYFDLNLLLQTGGGLEDQLVQNGLELAAIAVVPEVVLLLEIADLIRNRSLVFRVKGTGQHPVIQLRLGESLAKSFIQQIRRQLLQKVQPIPMRN